MNIVVNHLTLRSSPSDEALTALSDVAIPMCQEIEGFRSARLVAVDETHYMMVVIADSVDALSAISSGPGGAWVQDHLVPLFSAPPDRHVGTVIGGE